MKTIEKENTSFKDKLKEDSLNICEQNREYLEKIINSGIRKKSCIVIDNISYPRLEIDFYNRRRYKQIIRDYVGDDYIVNMYIYSKNICTAFFNYHSDKEYENNFELGITGLSPEYKYKKSFYTYYKITSVNYNNNSDNNNCCNIL